MFISQALAATTAAVDATAPSATQSFAWNMGLILLMFVLFYVLMIRPQQKRLKTQQAMLSALKVGDRVVTGGGFVGSVSRLVNDAEIEIDLGNGIKVTALRYTISTRVADDVKPAA